MTDSKITKAKRARGKRMSEEDAMELSSSDELEELEEVEEEDYEEEVRPKKKKATRRKGKAAKAEAEADGEDAPVKKVKKVVELPHRFVAMQEALPPRARLIINFIEMENFKSYAGVKRVGPFHKSFSAVVGPNGSGKSNVIDALQFVFGKRAAKIRFKKLGDLVHNSTTFSNLNKARVLVSFSYIKDAVDGSFVPVEGAEFTVERTVLKSGSCDYFLDGVRSSWGEVTCVLKAQGIDLDHNRFLILQGEVEQISLMKPKGTTANEEGLLEYLEDIIGSNRFVAPIEAAAKDLENAVVEHDAALTRANFAVGELDKLAGLKEEAEAHFDALMELCDKRSLLVRLDQRALDERERDARALEAELAESVEANMAALAEKEAALAAMDGAFRDERAAAAAAAEALEAQREALAEMERKEVALTEALKHGRETEKKLGAKIAKDAKALREKQAVSKLEAALPDLEAALEERSAAHAEREAELEEMYAALQGEAAQIHVALQAKQTELLPFTAGLNEARSAHEVALAELTLAKAAGEERVRELEAARTEAVRLESELCKQREALAQAEELLESGEVRVARMEQAKEELEKELQEQSQRVRQAQGRAAAAKSDNSSTTGIGRILVFLQEIADRKGWAKFKQLRGRLGDLGWIDKRYDVAMSTAAGAGLNNLVMETEQAAKVCVDLLTKKAAGRVTCSILEKQRGWAEQAARPCETPEGVPRLIDLIHMDDEEYRGSFYHILRDTLVCDTLEQAARIAYGAKRWRVVTLDGTLIDTTGTMSSSGGRPRHGLMRTSAKATKQHFGKDVKRDLAQLTEVAAKAAADLETLRTQHAECERELRAMRASVERAAQEAPRLRLGVESRSQTHAELLARLPALEKACAPTAAEKKETKRLEAAASKAAAALAAAEGETSELQRQIDELKESLESLGGERVKAQKAAVEALAAQVQDTSSKISKVRVQLTNAAKAIPKLEKSVAASETALEEAAREAAALEEQLASVMDECKATRDSFSEREAEVRAVEAAMKKATKEHDALSRSVAELKAAVAEARHKLDDVRASCSNSDAVRAKLAQKLAAEARKKHDLWKASHPTLEPEEGAEQVAATAPAEDKASEVGEAEEGGQESVVDEAENADKEKEGDEQGEEQAVEEKRHEPFELVAASDEELAEMSAHALKAVIQKLERRTTGASIHNGAIREYMEQARVVARKMRERDAAAAATDAARATHESLRKQRLDVFMEGFSFINLKLKETYQAINMGGDAEMEPRDHLDPFAEGIDFTVKPPKKSWKAIMNLSGGEKTLSSLSLVFALHQYKPTPIYVMDEIDAALDFRNVSIVAHYIKQRTKNDAQFIVISLRSDMFELADRLVGIYKTQDNTKSVTIDPAKFHIPGVAPPQAQPAARTTVFAPDSQPVAPSQAPSSPAASAAAPVVPSPSSQGKRLKGSDKGKEEANEEDSESLREITNAAE